MAKSKDIDAVYVFLSVDSSGQEGILAQLVGTKTIPFVTGDVEVAAKLFAIAEQTTRETGMKIKYCKFSKREVLNTLGRELH